MREIAKAYRKAITYAILFVIALTGILLLINANIWQVIVMDIKAVVMVTFFLTINDFLIRNSITHRALWNALFIAIVAIILYFIDLSLPTLALKIIAKLPLIGTGAEKLGVLLKVPESAMWALISVIYGWLAGLIEFEELPIFERAIILRLEELRYR